MKCAIKAYNSDSQISADSILDLIEWVYWRHNEHARHILRQKIFLSVAPTDFESALIKTAAKRWELVSDVNDDSSENVDTAALQVMREQSAIKSTEVYQNMVGEKFDNLQKAALWVDDQVAKIISSRNNEEHIRHKLPRPIVAALFDQNWKLTIAARNTNEVIRTRHAEMNLLHALGERSAAGHLIVSTQCCRMCAAAINEKISHEISQQKLKVYYLTPEPSLKNVKTALHGREQHLNVQSEQHHKPIEI